MEEGREGPIKSIFLCKFDTKLGPVIVCQYPENSLSKEIFESIHNYLIPGLQIKKRTITLSVFGLKVSGYPNEIKNSKYSRNALLFNLCFVCDAKSRTAQYEPVVKKISEYLEHLELENAFLSTEESNEKLPGILKTILEDMNTKGKCTVKIILKNQIKNDKLIKAEKQEISKDRRCASYTKKIEHSSKICKKSYDCIDCQEKIMLSENKFYVSVLNLKKVVTARTDPVQVQDHHVPILVCPYIDSWHHWDLTSQQILSRLNGLSHVAKIAAETDVHINLVKACVQNMVYYRIVKLLQIFQYSNMYTTLPGLHKLYTCKDIQEECLRSVSRSVVRQPSLANVFHMYSSLTYGMSVRDLCLRFKPQSIHVDERKLVQFGVLHSFIRRLHQFPVMLSQKPSTMTVDDVSSNAALYRLCNGSHCIDEICCKLGLTSHEVLDRLERDPNVVIIMK